MCKVFYLGRDIRMKFLDYNRKTMKNKKVFWVITAKLVELFYHFGYHNSNEEVA